MARVTMVEALAEVKTDLKWIKEGVKIMHDKQDKTNGRIGKLESVQDDYVTKEAYSSDKSKDLDNKTKVKIALIGGGVSLFVAFIGFLIQRLS